MAEITENREISGMTREELELELLRSREEVRILKERLDNLLVGKDGDRPVAEILRETAFQQALLIAELREKEEALKKLVITDGLTGLYNHRYFQQRLRESFERRRRYVNHGEFSLIMVDIDNFKYYNDTYGHPAGDRVLQKVAAVLLANARNSDIVARYGGEEFAILCHGGLKETACAAERFRREIEKTDFPGQESQPLLAGQSRGSLTICLGVGTYDQSMREPGELVSQADRKLYQAKKEGRNRVVS